MRGGVGLWGPACARRVGKEGGSCEFPLDTSQSREAWRSGLRLGKGGSLADNSWGLPGRSLPAGLPVPHPQGLLLHFSLPCLDCPDGGFCNGLLAVAWHRGHRGP